MATAITVRGLRKSYGEREIVHGIDLDVEVGETVGILGPNGAGKTTTLECIGGLRARDAGEVRVDGIDPAGGDRRLREVLGMQLQECRLPRKVTVQETVALYRSFYAQPRDTVDLLDRFGLTAQCDTRFENLSGAQRRRTSLRLRGDGQDPPLPRLRQARRERPRGRRPGGVRARARLRAGPDAYPGAS